MIRRCLFNVAAALSLLLMIAALALLVVSFDRSASYCWLRPERARVHVLFYDDGHIGYFHDESDYVDAKPGHHFANSFLTHLYPAGWARGVPQGNLATAPTYEFMGIIWAGATNIQHYTSSSVLTENNVTKVVVPLWMLIVLFGVIPTVWLVNFLHGHQRKQRFKRGCCTLCGYDLAGNVSGVCPECGTAIRFQHGREAHAENAKCAEEDPG